MIRFRHTYQRGIVKTYRFVDSTQLNLDQVGLSNPGLSVNLAKYKTPCALQ